MLYTRRPKSSAAASEAAAPQSTESRSRALQLKGTTYAEGAAQLAPSAGVTIAAGALSGQLAADGAFTPALLEALNEATDQPLQEILAQVAAGDVTTSSGRASWQDVNMTSVRGGADEATGEARSFVSIGNGDYEEADADLPAAIGEAQGMGGALSGRGYAGEVEVDQTAAEMATAVADVLASAVPGEDVVVYFAGHGTEAGLVGVDMQTLPYADLMSEVDAASSRGVEVTLVLDACHSGAAGDLSRAKQVEAASSTATAGSASAALLDLVARLSAVEVSTARAAHVVETQWTAWERARGLHIDFDEEVLDAAEAWWETTGKALTAELARSVREIAGVDLDVPGTLDQSPADLIGRLIDDILAIAARPPAAAP